MPENSYHQLLVFIQFICPKPLRCLLYNLAKETVTSEKPFDFDRFLLSEKTSLDHLVKTNKIRQSQYHRIYHIAGKSNINDLDVLSLVMLLQHMFGEVLTTDEANAIECIRRKYYMLHVLAFKNSTQITSDYFERTWTQLKEATLTLANHADETGDFRSKISELIAQAKCNYLPNASSYVQAWYKEVLTFQRQADNEEGQCFECKLEENVTVAMEEDTSNDPFLKILEDNATVVEEEDKNSSRGIPEKETPLTSLREEQHDVFQRLPEEETPLTSLKEEQHDVFQRLPDRSCHRIETTENEINGTAQLDKDIKHYKVPLTRWPRLQHSHEVIRTLIGYCHELEKKLELPGTVTQDTDHIDNVDVFVRDMAFDITYLSTEPEEVLQEDSEYMRYGMKNRFAGILIDSDGIRLIDPVSKETRSVKYDINMKSECHSRMSHISNLIELAVFKPLLEKINLLRDLICASSDLEMQDATESRILYDRSKPSETMDTARNRQHLRRDGMDYELNQDIIRNIRQHKKLIDRLLGEMIALTNRSENVRPMIEGYETKEISKQIAEDLFQLHPTIKWCGYRYSTLHIHTEHISDSSENDRLNEKIKDFLSRKDIKDYIIVVIGKNIKEYNYVGAEIQSEADKKATLGCFSVYKKGNQKSVCGLLSKHFVLGTSRIFVKDAIHFGTVLPATNIEGGLDIAAMEIVKQHIQGLDMSFKNYENETRPAYLYDNTDNKMLQDQPVYLRGAMTKLGVGTIHIPTLQCSDDTDKAYIQIFDGNFTLNMPFGRLAVEGDSGAILCMDELGTKNVCVISMLMGELLREPEEEERMYSTLRLSCGLKYLEDKTQGKFTLGGTFFRNRNKQILWDLLESLPTGTNETGRGEKTKPIENKNIDETASTD
ncbi:uncharacterized protein LOC123527634 [Mercenaria mercenaria]|uniref:uncharacterized protein LOC123527634 n=1 Tax=Mercenaria mercenaria TaxID=6596 RepID=UPI00234F86C5|nr:uncharacterized protein LOC123527634 [Mercenaria mercenaria]